MDDNAVGVEHPALSPLTLEKGVVIEEIVNQGTADFLSQKIGKLIEESRRHAVYRSIP